MNKTKYKYDIAVIGCGNMATAIIGCARDKFKLIVSDIDAKKVSPLVGKNVTAAASNADAAAQAKYVLLAVKPQAAEDALKGIDFSGKILISVMAGTTVARLSEIAQGVSGIVRTMPNISAQDGMCSGVVCYNGVHEKDEKYIEGFLRTFGLMLKCDEDKFSIVTGLTGSGPAFLFKFMRGLAAAALENGLKVEETRRLVGAMIYGGTVVVTSKERNENFEERLSRFIDEVCSPGGTTIEGVKYLDEMKFEDTVKEAVLRAKRRAEELSS